MTSGGVQHDCRAGEKEIDKRPEKVYQMIIIKTNKGYSLAGAHPTNMIKKCGKKVRVLEKKKKKTKKKQTNNIEIKERKTKKKNKKKKKTNLYKIKRDFKINTVKIGIKTISNNGNKRNCFDN